MRYLFLVFAFLVSSVACAQEKPPATPEKFVEGKHYLVLSSPVPPIVGADKVEVAEVFRFGCPACYKFEQVAQSWKKSKAEFIEFVKTPVVWNKDTEIRAQVYFTGERLGVGDETAMAIFRAIHEAPSVKASKTAMLKESDIFAMFETLGVDAVKAEKMYNNWFVKSKVNQSDGRARDFAIAGTPEIFVDGRYRITTTTAGDYATMLEVASFLAEKIAAERGIQ